MTIKVQTPARLLRLAVPALVGWLLLASTPQSGLAQSLDQRNSRLRIAQDLERRGLYDRALRIYFSLYQQVPRNQLYYEGVKRNLIRLDRFDELSTIVEEQIRRTGDPRFLADLGDVRFRSGRHEEARAIWRDLLEKHPQNRAVYPYVANAMISNRLYDEAIEVYLQARRNLNQPDLFVFELGNLYAIRLNYDAATREYLDFLEKQPNQFGYIESRIATYTKEPEQAHKVAELLQKRLEQSKHEYLMRKLLADLYLRIGDYSRSLQQFKILEAMTNPLDRKTKAGGQELYFFADKALRAGEVEHARQAFDLILTNYADSPFRFKALFGLAQAHQLQGRAEAAIRAYEDLIAAAPTSPLAYEAQMQIGEIYFEDLFDLERALDAFKAVVERFPNDPRTVEAGFRIGDCYLARGDLKEATTWYQKPLARRGVKPAQRDKALYKTAYALFLEGEYDAALERLNQITAAVAQKPASGEDYVNDAFELIFIIEENRKSEEALRAFTEAQRLQHLREFDQAMARLKDLVERFPQTPILDDALLHLGELARIQGHYEAAIGYFAQLVQEQPESVYAPLAQKRIGEVYEEDLGDAHKAYSAYEQVLIRYPNSLYLEEVRQRMRRLQPRILNN